MFVRYYTELPLSYEAVHDGAVDPPPEEWLPKLAADAEASTGRLLLDVGMKFAGLDLRQRGQVQLSHWQATRSGGESIHITWASAQLSSLFPTVDAEFEVAPLGSERTQLGLSAQYEPPLGWLGRGMDRFLLHRVAEAAAKDFIDSAARLVRERADHAGGPQTPSASRKV
jgi:hypothetical protein